MSLLGRGARGPVLSSRPFSVLLRGQPARRKAQAMLHLFSFIVWRTWSYLSCILASLWVLKRMSAVCWCCCCDAGGCSCGVGWSLRCTSAQSSAMTFFAFKRRLSRFLMTLSLFRTRLASSSASFSRSSSGSVKARGFSVWSREALDELWHSAYRTGQEKPW